MTMRRGTLPILGLGAALGCAAPDAAVAPEGPARESYRVGYRVLDLTSAGGGNAVTVAVWYPTTAEPRPHVYGGPTRGAVAVDGAPAPGSFPMLAFSHGYGGSGLSAAFLTEALAARGFIVAAPDHHDRHSAARIRTGAVEGFDRTGLLRHASEIASSSPADRGAYAYRLDELRAVIDEMLADKAIGPHVDRGRIAVGGHSFGGYTALGLAGTIPERHDARIKALLLFSSGAAGYLFTDEEIASVKVPSIYLFGEREREQLRGDRTMEELASKLYGSLPHPKHLVEVRGAGHFSFNGRLLHTVGSRLLSGSDAEHDVIRRYSIAFLEKHLAGRGDPEGILERQDPRLSRYVRDDAARK